MSGEELQAALLLLKDSGSLKSVALYADSTVPYSSVVRVLDIAARNDIKMVLATHPASVAVQMPSEETDI